MHVFQCAHEPAVAPAALNTSEPHSSLIRATATLGTKNRVYSCDDAFAALFAYDGQSDMLATPFEQLCPSLVLPVCVSAQSSQQHVFTCALTKHGHYVPIMATVAYVQDCELANFISFSNQYEK
jgi:hypothetical protein